MPCGSEASPWSILPGRSRRNSAELVVAGIGGPGIPATIDDLALGLATACQLVQHGGKIVVLSRVRGDIGPAVRSLVDIEDPKRRAAALRGHEADDDYVAARGWPRAWHGPTCLS